MSRYTPAGPGAWPVVLSGRRLLAVEPGAGDRLDRLETVLAEGFVPALEALAADGILAAPAFALLDWSGGPLRAVLRGDATLRVERDALVASGEGVQTWTERLVEAPGSFVLEIPGGRIAESALDGAPDGDDGAEPAASAPPPARVLAEPVPASAVPAAVEPAASGRDTETTIVPSELTTAAAPVVDPAPAGDPLLGDTVYRTVAGAAVRLRGDDAERLGDHDGETVAASDIAGLSERSRPPTDETRAATPAVQPRFSLVSARGEREPLDRGVVIGRAPSVSQVSGGSIPRLLTIPDDADISRNHVRIAIEGDAPLVTDLGSKNGTTVVQPGKPPQRLRGNEPTIVLPGTVVDLGGGATFTVEQLP